MDALAQGHVAWPSFSCSHCARAIPEDAPIYMRSDRAFCSKDCRSHCICRSESTKDPKPHVRHERVPPPLPPRRPAKTVSCSQLSSLAGAEAITDVDARTGILKAATEEQGEACDSAFVRVVNVVAKAVLQGLRVLARTQGILIDRLTTILFLPIGHISLPAKATSLRCRTDASRRSEEETSSDESDAPSTTFTQIYQDHHRLEKKTSFSREVSNASTACSFTDDDSCLVPPISALYSLTKAPWIPHAARKRAIRFSPVM